MSQIGAKSNMREDIARSISKKQTHNQAEKELKYCTKNGIIPISSTSDSYPQLLRETSDYPHVLYVRGNVSALAGLSLSMVGTRHITQYGVRMCDEIVAGLSQRLPKLVIVSGLAFGCDVNCHRAALRHGLPTVGVVANTLPDVTPTQHSALARDMIESGGAVISELHSQSKQTGDFYLARNRIIASISGGTLVVESPVSGGSMKTAEMVDSYERVAMALPGRATDFASSGCNMLIRNRKAQMILTADDIIREMMWDIEAEGYVEREKPTPVQLSADEQGLLRCFRTDDPLSVGELAELSSLGVGELSALLLNLELAGAVRQLPGQRYERLVKIG